LSNDGKKRIAFRNDDGLLSRNSKGGQEEYKRIRPHRHRPGAEGVCWAGVPGALVGERVKEAGAKDGTTWEGGDDSAPRGGDYSSHRDTSVETTCRRTKESQNGPDGRKVVQKEKKSLCEQELRFADGRRTRGGTEETRCG